MKDREIDDAVDNTEAYYHVPRSVAESAVREAVYR